MTYSPSRQMMADGNLITDSLRYAFENYGSNRSRYQWGIAHRRWLLDSGRYIRTSSPSLKMQREARIFHNEYVRVIREAGPELINLRDTDRRTIRAMYLDERDD